MGPDGNTAGQKSTLEIWLNFISTFAWPLAILAVVFIFRGQLNELTGRVKTSEFAGAKFEFSEAAAGYIRASVSDLAKEQSPLRREQLAQNIRGVADALNALHPRSLALLITGVKGCHSWGGDLSDEQPYFVKLEALDLVRIIRTQDSGGENIALKYTKKGKDLLLNIGMSPDDVNSAEKCR